MSWGTKITILYLSFVGLVVCLVTMSMREKIDLVTANYYEEELKYQDRINAINLTGKLSQPLTWEITGEKVVLHFPVEVKGEQLKGTVYFFRPSDAGLDKTFTIPADTSLTRSIQVKNLQKGVYKMQISWEAGEEKYYNETVVSIR